MEYKQILLTFTFYGTLLFIIIYTMADSMIPPMLRFCMVLIMSILFMVTTFAREYLTGSLASENFWLADKGISGTLSTDRAEPLQNGMVKRWVYFPKQWIPDYVRNSISKKGKANFISAISGNVKVPVVGHANDFEELKGNDCYAIEGTMVLWGRDFFGKRVPSMKGNFHELDLLRQENATLRTVGLSLQNYVNQLSKERDKTMKDVAQELITIVNPILDRAIPFGGSSGMGMMNPMMPNMGGRGGNFR